MKNDVYKHSDRSDVQLGGKSVRKNSRLERF